MSLGVQGGGRAVEEGRDDIASSGVFVPVRPLVDKTHKVT